MFTKKIIYIISLIIFHIYYEIIILFSLKLNAVRNYRICFLETFISLNIMIIYIYLLIFWLSII